MNEQVQVTERYRKVIENLSGSSSEMIEMVKVIEEDFGGSEFTADELYGEKTGGITKNTMKAYLYRFTQSGITEKVGKSDNCAAVYKLKRHSDEGEGVSLSQFLEKGGVRRFLEREGITPSEVEWFTQNHIKDVWWGQFEEDAIGVASIMCLLGVEITGVQSRNWWGAGQHESVVLQLGYEDGFGSNDWAKVYNLLVTHGPFTKTMLDHVRRYHNLTDDDVDQRVILAAAEITYEDAFDWKSGKQARRICDRHDTTYSRVNEFFEEFNGGEDE